MFGRCKRLLNLLETPIFSEVNEVFKDNSNFVSSLLYFDPPPFNNFSKSLKPTDPPPPVYYELESITVNPNENQEVKVKMQSIEVTDKKSLHANHSSSTPLPNVKPNVGTPGR